MSKGVISDLLIRFITLNYIIATIGYRNPSTAKSNIIFGVYSLLIRNAGEGQRWIHPKMLFKINCLKRERIVNNMLYTWLLTKSYTKVHGENIARCGLYVNIENKSNLILN